MTSFPIEYLSYIVLALIFLVIILIGAIIRMNNRMSKLLYGTKDITIEDALHHIIDDLKKSMSIQKTHKELISQINNELLHTISGVGVVRYNPFEGSSGSNQSFAVAFIDKQGNGVVFSSLYSRERVSVFAKPLEKFTSTHTLTEEELQALGKARGL